MAVFLVPRLAFSLFGVGDTPTNYCWMDVDDKKVCLEDDFGYAVRVLLFNAGWCGPCNDEFGDLEKATAEFKNKQVYFISLSSEGWNRPSRADRTFLQEWRDKHGLDKAAANFVIAASPRHSGEDFFNSPGIPNVVIIDTRGKVAYKAINPGVDKIVQEVRKICPRPLGPPPP